MISSGSPVQVKGVGSHCACRGRGRLSRIRRHELRNAACLQLFGGGGSVRWVLRLVETKGERQSQGTDIMEIARSDDLGEIVAAPARGHAVRRANCRACGGKCRVKDYWDQPIATLFGRVALRLPQFRCKACCAAEAGVRWPMNCRSAPELDEL